MAKGIGDVIYSLLSNSTDVTDIVSTRIYPFLAIEDVVYPYLVYTIENVDPTVSNCGASSLDTVSVNLEIYTETLAELEDLGDKVRNALDRYKGTTEGVDVQIIAYQNEDYGYADEDRVYLKIQSYNSRLLTISAYFNRVTDLVATGSSDSQIDLTWSDVATGETGYEVWSSSDFISWTLIATTSADAVSYSNTGLTAETPYAYKIRAVDTDDKGVWSNIALGSTESVVAAQSGIAYQYQQNNQTTSYATYDAAWHLVNTPIPTNPTYPLYYAELDVEAVDPINTLKNLNEFGTLDRFTDELGTQVYANNYKVDHLYNLGWYEIASTGLDWVGNLNAANALTHLGFSDFRVPNMNEVNSNYSFNGRYLVGGSTISRGSSNTRFGFSANYNYGFYIDMGANVDKTVTSISFYFCRYHF
jgi:hypothetical protein